MVSTKKNPTNIILPALPPSHAKLHSKLCNSSCPAEQQNREWGLCSIHRVASAAAFSSEWNLHLLQHAVHPTGAGPPPPPPPSLSPSHGLQFFVNCSREGHKSCQKICSGMGSSFHRSTSPCQDPAPAWVSQGITASSQAFSCFSMGLGHS